jgi:hypothetical protein
MLMTSLNADCGNVTGCEHPPLNITRKKRSAADVPAKEWRWKNPIVYKFSDDIMRQGYLIVSHKNSKIIICRFFTKFD